MLVSFESDEIRAQAVLLWQEAFGDSEEYINFFLNSHTACRVLTQTDDTLRSMLFLIDGEMFVENEKIPSFYLFAACTFKRYRGQGCMARLLRQAAEYAARQGREYIALVPAESSLFDYYGKFGYKTVFYNEPTSASGAQSVNLNISRFYWADAHREYVKQECERFGGEYISVGGEVFTVNNGVISVPSKSRAQRYGMLLPLTERALNKLPDNAYIGLTLE